MMQEEVTAEVNVLLSLKKQYKDLTGEDFVPVQQPKKPDTAGKAKQTVVTSVPEADVKVIREQIESQGQKVREMKASGAAKVVWQIYTHISVLFVGSDFVCC